MIDCADEHEARLLLPLLKAGETPESVRDLIGTQRGGVLRAFDYLILRTAGDQRRKRMRRGELSPMLRAEIFLLLKKGLCHKEIYRRIPVGYKHIAAVAKHHRASTWRIGRGRRLTDEKKERIRAAVQSRRRSADVQRELGVDYDTVKLFRTEVGDLEDRRHWRCLSPEQVDAARAMLLSGVTWKGTAAHFRVGLSTLQTNLPGFKTGRPSGRKKRENGAAS